MAGQRKGKISLVERFFSKVEINSKENNSCWLWKGSTYLNGYGSFCVAGRKPNVASRVSWQIAHGEIPEGMVVCHICDNKLCVRPSHLFLGTQADNINDMKQKGRMAYGDKLPHTKLSDKEVSLIRSLDLPAKVIAKTFNISPGYVYELRHKHKRKKLKAENNECN